MAKRGSAPETVNIRAVSFEAVAIEGQGLPFPMPYSDGHNENDFAFVWRMLHYAFDLPNPHDFPSVRHLLASADILTMSRYIDMAEELSASSFLRHRTGVTFTPDDPNGTVVAEFPPGENIRGFSVLFRQFHSNDEDASFQAMQRVLRRAISALPDQERARCAEVLSTWGRAVGRLRAFQLKVLVTKKLFVERGWVAPPMGLPGEKSKPDELISLYNYGEDLHWGRHRERLAVIKSDPFKAAWTRMDFFESVNGLAHTFIGFSLLVNAALGGFEGEVPDP